MASRAARAEAGAEVEAARDAFFEHAQQFTSVVTVDWEGLRVLISTADKGLGQRLFAKRWRRDAIVLKRVLLRLDAAGLGTAVRRGIFLDVGANIGTASLYAVSRAGFRQAIAVEPEPRNVSLLEANIAINSLGDRVEVHRLAAGAAAGSADLALSEESSGSHRLGSVGNRRTIPVECITLDGLLDRRGLEPEDVGLLWIDVNGSEAEVLSGASRLLAAKIPVVFEVGADLGRLPTVVTSYSAAVSLRGKTRERSAASVSQLAAELEREGRTATDVLLVP